MILNYIFISIIFYQSLSYLIDDDDDVNFQHGKLCYRDPKGREVMITNKMTSGQPPVNMTLTVRVTVYGAASNKVKSLFYKYNISLSTPKCYSTITVSPDRKSNRGMDVYLKLYVGDNDIKWTTCKFSTTSFESDVTDFFNDENDFIQFGVMVRENRNYFDLGKANSNKFDKDKKSDNKKLYMKQGLCVSWEQKLFTISTWLYSNDNFDIGGTTLIIFYCETSKNLWTNLKMSAWPCNYKPSNKRNMTLYIPPSCDKKNLYVMFKGYGQKAYGIRFTDSYSDKLLIKSGALHIDGMNIRSENKLEPHLNDNSSVIMNNNLVTRGYCSSGDTTKTNRWIKIWGNMSNGRATDVWKYGTVLSVSFDVLLYRKQFIMNVSKCHFYH